MSASINFYGTQGGSIYSVGGSGLGFYGPGSFGTSIRVGQYQDNTYITDATGAIQGPKVNNVKYVNPLSGQLPTSDIHALQDIPNYLASLRIDFTNDTPCQVHNAQLRIFDRANINNPPSGVVCQVAQVVHPWNTMQPTGPLGSGDTQWQMLGGSGGLIGGVTYAPPINLVNSPGSGGLSPSGSSTTDVLHQWWANIAVSPNVIGSSTQFALYVSLEYL